MTTDTNDTNDNHDIIKELRERLARLESERTQFDVTAQTAFARKMGEFEGRISEVRQVLLVLDDGDEDDSDD